MADPKIGSPMPRSLACDRHDERRAWRRGGRQDQGRCFEAAGSRPAFPNVSQEKVRMVRIRMSVAQSGGGGRESGSLPALLRVGEAWAAFQARACFPALLPGQETLFCRKHCSTVYRGARAFNAPPETVSAWTASPVALSPATPTQLLSRGRADS